MLIVHGMSDGFGLAQPRALQVALPKADLHMEYLPSCGHLPFVECPEPFFVALRRFLAARP